MGADRQVRLRAGLWRDHGPEHPDGDGRSSRGALRAAAILFGSVLAVTLAKAFAELLAHALETGERVTRRGWRVAWRHSTPTLAVVNLPTLLFIMAGLGWITVETAVQLAQVVCIVVLMVVGARVGWVIDKRPLPAFAGMLFAGGIGLALALLKYLIH
jgi:hypothetical protein